MGQHPDKDEAVTPAMIQAGLGAWTAWEDSADCFAENLVESIYRAMWAARPRPLSEQ
jgi:hypothetical protein